ncbi:MAG: hypothetical protein R3C61_01250 [Bacteroidia bacterium]
MGYQTLKRVFFLTWIAAFCLMALPSQGQILDNENKINLTLSDGTAVTLYGAAASLSDEKTKDYYYMPTNLRLSKKPDGTPMFLFLKFTDEDNADAEASGAILHLLMEYGLTKEQETELTRILRARYEGAVLKGAAEVEPDGDNSIRVISATLTGARTRTLVMSGKAPVFPGNKIAVAAELDKKGAQLLDATFQKTRSITDLSINLSYNYTVRVPAARGFYEEDWSKMDSLHLLDSAYFSKEVKEEKDYGEKAINGVVGAIAGGPIGLAIGWFGSGNKKTTKFKYDELRTFYRKMEELGVVTVRFEENVDDQRVAAIREAFFQHFLNSFTEKEAQEIPSPGKQEKLEMPNIKVGDEYKFRREFAETIIEKRKRTFNLSYALAVKKSFQMTENLASWYDNVRDNPKCVGTVLLNDPFFQHRDVNVIMDLDAEDMMGKELNYVTVSLRKQRSVKGANDFSHQLTFDRKFFEENGNRATVTYSKAQDGDPDEYEYKVQWSLRGGNIFPPADTTWTKGSWQGVTLAPPVNPRNIRYEVDLDELSDLGIRNVTLQLRYEKFGKEVETNMNIGLYSKQPYMEKTIYMDKNTRGYAYRLIFTHKEKGPMVTDWEAKINTDYIFAVVPEQLRKGDQSFIDQMLERGKQIVAGGSRDAEVQDGQKVLDKFKDVITTN